jgi:hypothetical protein
LKGFDIDDDLTDAGFNEDIARALVVNNIRLNILNDVAFKELLEKYAKRPLMSRTTYRTKLVPALYSQGHLSIINQFKNHPFYLILDETPDFSGRKIINILAGKLLEREYTKPFLINTLELEAVNRVHRLYFIKLI